jgi:hypothetical protein
MDLVCTLVLPTTGWLLLIAIYLRAHRQRIAAQRWDVAVEQLYTGDA